MKIAMLSSIAHRTPPQDYGPWEYFVSNLTECLHSRGIDVTLFATSDSITQANLHSVCPKGYEEDRSLDAKVWEYLHISEVFERAEEFDLIHNNFDFMPLVFSRFVETPLLTTIHGFSSPKILPIYEKYNADTFYVSISDADRSEKLDYIDTIYHGIELNNFTFRKDKEGYLLFFGRIHPDKGTKETIEIAKRAGKKLIIAGIIQDEEYFEREVKPQVNGSDIVYFGVAGPEKRDELLGKAEALLHPINFDEPFGLSVVEAMACGTPPIAINRGSMGEIIENGISGFLVNNVGEAVEVINKNLCDINKEKCREVVERKFSRERMTDRYIEVYKKITK